MRLLSCLFLSLCLMQDNTNTRMWIVHRISTPHLTIQSTKCMRWKGIVYFFFPLLRSIWSSQLSRCSNINDKVLQNFYIYYHMHAPVFYFIIWSIIIYINSFVNHNYPLYYIQKIEYIQIKYLLRCMVKLGCKMIFCIIQCYE